MAILEIVLRTIERRLKYQDTVRQETSKNKFLNLNSDMFSLRPKSYEIIFQTFKPLASGQWPGFLETEV